MPPTTDDRPPHPLAAGGENVASHRDGRGCFARRMQPDFHHGLVATGLDLRVLGDEPYECSAAGLNLRLLRGEPCECSTVKLADCTAVRNLCNSSLRTASGPEGSSAKRILECAAGTPDCGAVRNPNPFAPDLIEPAWRHLQRTSRLHRAAEAPPATCAEAAAACRNLGEGGRAVPRTSHCTINSTIGNTIWKSKIRNFKS
jgi:hypothetical protein